MKADKFLGAAENGWYFNRISSISYSLMDFLNLKVNITSNFLGNILKLGNQNMIRSDSFPPPRLQNRIG